MPLRFLLLLLGIACLLHAQSDPLAAEVSRVCDVLRAPASHSGKPIAIIGRFSFREFGRFLSEAACDPDTGVETPVLEVVFETKAGPNFPQGFSLDRNELQTRLTAIKRRTRLGQFRFGSTDYDRWAVVYGKFETRSAVPAPSRRGEFTTVSGKLVTRSETMVLFIPDEPR